MSRTVLRVTFADGSTFDAKINARALITAERHYGEKMTKIEGSLYAAWSQAAPGVDFETWIDSIDTMSEETMDPTEAAPSNGSHV